MRNFNTLGSCSKASQPKKLLRLCWSVLPMSQGWWLDPAAHSHVHSPPHSSDCTTCQRTFPPVSPHRLHHPLPFVITLVSSGLISWHLWISNCMWNVEIRGTGAGDKRRVKPTLKNHENVAAQYPVTPTTSFSLVYIHKSFTSVKNELMIHA